MAMPKRILLRGSLLVCLLVPVSLLSQTSPQTSPPPASAATQQIPPGWVDGSKNPELIPDHASYRLVLVHLSSLDTTRQDTRIKMMGLSADDGQRLKNEVALFHKDYDQWKAKAGVAAGAPPSQQDDQAARALVLASRDAIKKQLSADGAAKFSAYVEKEKARMIVNPK